jgi:hypothetical protein
VCKAWFSTRKHHWIWRAESGHAQAWRKWGRLVVHAQQGKALVHVWALTIHTSRVPSQFFKFPITEPSIFDLQPSLASLFSSRFADPHHAARHGIRGVFVQNELDKLSSFEAGGPSYFETVLLGIEDEAWNPLHLPPIFNDQTRALFQGCSLQSSALGNGSAGHCSPSIYLRQHSKRMEAGKRARRAAVLTGPVECCRASHIS